ncbi:MAG TPA: translation elongation factor 4 [Actinomycetota bacterium]|nr:translation elongation factor 4 [Actinomycetota bacterium]
MPTDLARLRNFCIIAHIDHGKSTLADRLLDLTHAVSERQMRAQYLDKMDLERERGITIKAQAVRLAYTAADGLDYVLDLIDTPGHVDFTYEVSRALAACEGAVLLVDAAQGIEAQTLANLYLALEADLAIIPVINKIDLPAAQPERVAREIEQVVGIPSEEMLRVSAKTGEGVPALLEAIVQRLPAPKGDPDGPTRALIFDSLYDSYRGVITYVRMVDGRVRKGDRVRMMATGAVSESEEVGVFAPEAVATAELAAGEVGYLIPGLKDVAQAKVGETVTTMERRAAAPLPGYREPRPMVYAGLYPIEGDDFPDLRDALDRLRLNDAALVYEPETSAALGFGFRCGFLGLLHMEIVRERLEREFDLELITTAPSVAYRVTVVGGETITVSNPSELPDPSGIERIEEPYVDAMILCPSDYIGAVMELCQGRRGTLQGMEYLSEERVELRYRLPLAEIIFDFFDQLKSRTRGYASLDYEPSGYRPADLVKVDVLLQGEPIDAFSAIVHKDKAYAYGRAMASKLKRLIPRQLFEVPIQASIGSRVIARETITARRKDVLAKCYGGDITRKRKLLERQREGKRRMKQIGRVEVPQEAFVAALRTDEGGTGR